MSFQKLNYTKNWEDPRDFPTIETSEAQVRADIQDLYDQMRVAFNNLIDALESTTPGDSGLDNIGAYLEGFSGSTIGEILSNFSAQFAAYYTKTQSDAKYATLTNTYTKTQSDARYAGTSVFTRSANGLAPQAPSGTGTTKFLREDGSWAEPAGGGGGGGGATNTVDGITGETITRYGICSTAATQAAKTVSITAGTFVLGAGATVTVKFNSANTANSPTLNVNSKGAKNIFHKGVQITSGANKALLAGICSFVYDGTQWHLVGNYIDTTYESKAAAAGGTELSLVTTGEKANWDAKVGTVKVDGVTGNTQKRYGACSTAGATAAKVVAISTGTFSLEAGARVTVKFNNANTANSPTLNVSSTGAKNIYHKGSQITSGANKALLAGVCDFVYDGTQYHLVGNYIDTNTTYSLVSTSGNGLAPTLPSSSGTSKYLRGDGSWETPPNTTSGTTYAAASVPNNTTFGTNGSIKNVYDATKHSTATATLAVANWSSNSITVSVSGVTASNTVIVSPAPASLAAWSAAGVYCSAQGSGQLTFTCATTPTVALTANIIIMS